jgi:hypothetical protein
MRFGWFREYRQAQQAVSIAFQTHFARSNGNTFLYVNVEVENLGASEIRAVSAELSVGWLLGDAEVGTPQQFRRVFTDDRRSLYLIDKGEYLTLAFAAMQAPPPPSAAHILFTLSSENRLANGQLLSWVREEIHVNQQEPPVS